MLPEIRKQQLVHICTLYHLLSMLLSLAFPLAKLLPPLSKVLFEPGKTSLDTVSCFFKLNEFSLIIRRGNTKSWYSSPSLLPGNAGSRPITCKHCRLFTFSPNWPMRCSSSGLVPFLALFIQRLPCSSTYLCPSHCLRSQPKCTISRVKNLA